jgi:hypothetical protein
MKITDFVAEEIERFQGTKMVKKPFYDIYHVFRATFVTLEIQDQIRDTIFVYPSNKLSDNH